MPARAHPAVAAVARGAALLLFWFVLARGDLSSWWFAIPAVGLALAVSMRLQPAGPRWRWPRMASLLVFFVRHSLSGGIDVARRALSLRQSLEPAFVDFELRLPPGEPSVLFVDIASLLPGTLSTELKGTLLRLHVLDARMSVEPVLRALEGRIAALHDVRLEPGAD